MHCALGHVIAVAVAATGRPAVAQPGWTVTNLHPPTATESRGLGVDGDQHVGFARINNMDRAALWHGTAASWVDLTPDGAFESRALGVRQGQQVGWARLGNHPNAGLWHGSAQTWVDLHPYSWPLERWSEASATDGVRQAGHFQSWTSVWSGSAPSIQEWFTPSSSRATGIHGDQVVGVYNNGGSDRAFLRSQAGQTWVDLTPLVALGSAAHGVHGAQQVGEVRWGIYSHAVLWNGVADSYISLHPSGATASVAWGVFDGVQVGSACIPGSCRATLWRGNSVSAVDLHSYLSTEFNESQARAVWRDLTTTRVVGDAFNTITGRYEAIIWRSCHADSDGDGTVTVSDIFHFLSAWFAGDTVAANFNDDCCINVGDIFAFLTAWFAGCP